MDQSGLGHLTVDGRIVGRRGRWNHREKREEKEKGSRVDGEWLSSYTGSQSTRRQGRSPHATVGSPSGMEGNSSSVGPSNSRSNNSSESEGMRRKRQTAARTTTATTSDRISAEAVAVPPMEKEWKTVQNTRKHAQE